MLIVVRRQLAAEGRGLSSHAIPPTSPSLANRGDGVRERLGEDGRAPHVGSAAPAERHEQLGRGAPQGLCHGASRIGVGGGWHADDCRGGAGIAGGPSPLGGRKFCAEILHREAGPTTGRGEGERTELVPGSRRKADEDRTNVGAAGCGSLERGTQPARDRRAGGVLGGHRDLAGRPGRTEGAQGGKQVALDQTLDKASKETPKGKTLTMRILKSVALLLVIVGAVNWLLVGLANFDLVAALTGSEFGETNVISSIVYILVGLSGIALLPTLAAWLTTDDQERVTA